MRDIMNSWTKQVGYPVLSFEEVGHKEVPLLPRSFFSFTCAPSVKWGHTLTPHLGSCANRAEQDRVQGPSDAFPEQRRKGRYVRLCLGRCRVGRSRLSVRSHAPAFFR